MSASSFDSFTRTAVAQAVVDACGATGAIVDIYMGTMPLLAATALYSSTVTSVPSGTSGTAMTVASFANTPASGNFAVLVDSEWMTVTAGHGTVNWTVTRGAFGSTAATHTNGAAITNYQRSAGGTFPSGKIAASVSAGVWTLDFASMTQVPSGFVNGLASATYWCDFKTSGGVVRLRVPVQITGSPSAGALGLTAPPINGQALTNPTPVTGTAGNTTGAP